MMEPPRKKIKAIRRAEWHEKICGVDIRKEHMNKLVMDYFIKEGYDSTAAKFYEESGTEPAIDLASMETRASVKRSILCAKMKRACQLLINSYPELVNRDPQLRFCMLQQTFIEFVRSRNLEEALKFVQQFLRPFVDSNKQFLEALEHTMTLLMYKDPYNCPARELLGMPRLLNIANEVNKQILSYQGDEKDSILCTLLKTLKWIQHQLERETAFPHTNLTTGRFEYPVVLKS